MTDYEVSSKEHEANDECSITTTQDSKSALPDISSPPSERSSHDSDEHRRRSEENDSSLSQQIAPLRSPEHDLVIDEFKKHFAAEDRHSGSEKTVSESSRSDEEDEERGAIRIAKYEQKPAKTNDSHLRRKVSADEHLNERQREKIDNSKGHMQESGNESSSEKSYTSSDRTRNAAKKVTKDEKSSKFEKIFLLELEPELNQVDVRQNFEPLMKPVPFVPPLTVSDGGHHQDAHKVDHNDFSSAHPPQIHVDFGERRPTDDDRESERYSTKDEEQKQEPEKVLKPSKEGKREENVGGVEFEKQKPIQTIVEMFGGSVAHDRIDALSDDGNEGDSKGGQSLMSKRGVPAVAVKYVEAVNAAPVIKNRTSAYDELYFYDESLDRTSENEEEEVESENEDDRLHPEMKNQGNRVLTEDERYMSVRVVRNVREYVEKHDHDSSMMIKMLYEKNNAKHRDDKKTKKQEPKKKETGVQVYIEEDSKGANSIRQHDIKKQSALPVAERKKVFESDDKKRIVEEIDSKKIQEKKAKKSSEGGHQQSAKVTSNERNGGVVEKKNEETQVENKEFVDDEPKYHIKIKRVSQRRQIFESATAANASTQ